MGKSRTVLISFYEMNSAKCNWPYSIIGSGSSSGAFAIALRPGLQVLPAFCGDSLGEFHKAGFLAESDNLLDLRWSELDGLYLLIFSRDYLKSNKLFG